MTLDEFKNALLYAAKDETITSISSIEEVDIDRIYGIVLFDKKFVNFHKGNLVEIDIDLENEQITLGYRFLEKNPHDLQWYKRTKYQIIPLEMIDKVYIFAEKTEFIGANIPFGLRLERNTPYYLSSFKLLNFIANSASSNTAEEDNEGGTSGDEGSEPESGDTGEGSSGSGDSEDQENNNVGTARADYAKAG